MGVEFMEEDLLQMGHFIIAQAKTSLEFMMLLIHTTWNKIKTVTALDVNWTITSMDTTENEERLVYSSISSYLHILDLQTLGKFHHKIDLTSQENDEMDYLSNYCGIFNCKFSGDGSELVCVSSSGKIIIYSLKNEK